MGDLERKTSVKKYILAFVLTLLVFSGGIVAGLFIENLRLSSARQIALTEKVTLRSLQLQHNYIASGLTDCKTLHTILENNINELGKKVALIIDYEKKALFNEEEFKLQLQDYFLTEIQFYLLAKDIDKKCPQDNIKILYFYDENRDETQGDILVYLKKKFDNKVLIFSLDSGFMQEPMIKTILTNYKITQFPALVIEEKVFEGHQAADQLMQHLCTEFLQMNTAVPEECLSYSKEKIALSKNPLTTN
ncbi:MAG: hypothetical protein Q8R47_03810 [Nanoarchaeota archaeon]|nr:hypothetical protein [Nanoarchaeota archaeon]